MLLNPLVPKMTCLVLALLILVQLYIGISSFFYDSAPPQPAPQKKPVISNQANQIASVLQFPFFGEYIPEDINATVIKKSMLNLKVVGVMYATDEMKSQVIIHSAGDIEKTYQIGDKLPGGVIIKRITPKGVLVSHDGEIERLSLPISELIFEPPAKPLIKE